MRRLINLTAFLMLAAMAVGLYMAKSDAKADSARVAALVAELDAEQEAVRVMRNEIGYLESPERLSTLAREHLGLVPLDPLRVVTLEDAPLLIEPPATAAVPSPSAEAAYTDDQ